MLDIFKPENDKKRLIVLLVILVAVMTFSLVYKSLVLTPDTEVPVRVETTGEQKNDTKDTVQNTQQVMPADGVTPGASNADSNVPMPPSVDEINKKIAEQKAKNPLPSTEVDTKKIADEVSKNVPSTPVTQ